MNYLIAVLADRIQAEEAYSVLEREGVPLAQLTLLGKGYKSADEYGLIDPSAPARKQAKFMAVWLVPFGFVGGAFFSFTTGLDTFAWAGEIGNHAIGGLLGAISGGMGALVAGGGIGLLLGAGDALKYRNRLNEGKYLLVVQGSEPMTRKATALLRPLNPESMQGYAAPDNERER